MKKMKAKKSDKKAFLQYFENQHEGKLPNYFFPYFCFCLIFEVLYGYLKLKSRFHINLMDVQITDMPNNRSKTHFLSVSQPFSV